MQIWRGSDGATFRPDARYYNDTHSVYVQLHNKPYYRSTTNDDLRIIDLDVNGTIIGVSFRAIDKFGIDVSDLPESETIRELLIGKDLKDFIVSPSNQHPRAPSA